MNILLYFWEIRKENLLLYLAVAHFLKKKLSKRKRMNIALFLLAILPGLLICYFIFNMDKYEKEPQIHLAVCFLLGVFCTLPAINMEQIGKTFFEENNKQFFKIFLFATFVIALSEEILKFFALMFYAYPRRVFNEPLDGIVYSMMVSMGFATLENILYAQSYGFTTVVARAFTAVPAHAVFAILMGFYVGKAKFEEDPVKKTKLMVIGIIVAVFAHGIYDFLLLQGEYQILMMLGTILIVVGVYYGKGLIEQQQQISPFRTDQQDELSVGELAASDRLRFIQDVEIINVMLQRMEQLGHLSSDWAEVYIDAASSDKWLKYNLSKGFTDDFSPRMVRLPGPSPREVINLIFMTEHEDEIISAAEYFRLKEQHENEPFRENLIAHLEEFDKESLSHFHKERLVLFILETKLNNEAFSSNCPEYVSHKAHELLHEWC